MEAGDIMKGKGTAVEMEMEMGDVIANPRISTRISTS